jgi:hypothetical protein
MIRSVLLALALLGAPLSYAAPLASPFSNSIYPAQTFTASNQTGSAIQLNGLTVPSQVGSSFASGTITVTGTSLTTATFSVWGSSDGGATYFVLPIINPLAAPSSSAPATAVTVTANGTYMVSLAGITHVELVTSGTFTATALSLTLTASPNGQVSRNRGGGSFTPPSGSGNQAYMTPDGSSGPATLRFIAPSDLPAATSSTQGTVKPDGTTCTVTAGVLTCTGGTGGGGSVGTGPNGAVAGYVNAGTGNGVLPLPKLYYINQTMTLTQINAVFAAADVNSLVIIGNKVPQYAWNNVHDAQVQDNRINAMDWSDWFARKGVVCDYIYNLHGGGGYTLTQGVDQLSIGSDPFSVGSRMIFSQVLNPGTSAVIQNVWMPHIVTPTGSFPFVTLSGPAPFNYSGGAANGTDNAVALQAILDEAGATFPVRIPDGCSAFTSLPLNWKGTSIFGTRSGSLGSAPGQDLLQAVNGNATHAGVEVHGLNVLMNNDIDPTLGYRLWSDDGSTYTSVPPMFRPTLNNTADANFPLNSRWLTGGNNGGGTNGVANTTAGSAVICVPTALGRTPANGNKAVFPYLVTNAVFNGTVLNQTGAGCGGGFVGVTLDTPVPTGGTATQAYYESAAAFDMGLTGIGTTVTYPVTITDSLPKGPDPTGFSAPFGRVIIGNNSVRMESDYLGNNWVNTPGSGQIILRKGPATITSALTSGSYFIIPSNPCMAMFETPPPVFPNINGSGSETPANAVDISGGCVGNAAISFPEPDGRTPSTGLVSSFIGPVTVNTTNVNGPVYNVAGGWFQGNAAPYSVSFPDWKIENFTYGFAEGPASLHNWGVLAIGPTAAGNSFTNCQIHAAFPMIFTDLQQTTINRCDTYSAWVSPYDNTLIGPATAFATSFTTSEQTGGTVTITGQLDMTEWNDEPNTHGSLAAIPPFAHIESSNSRYSSDNFEGALSIIGGSNNVIRDSQLSLPIIDKGLQNKFENNTGTFTSFWMTNNWADNSQQWFHWGFLSSCSQQQALTSFGGPKGNCAAGYSEDWTGHSAAGSFFGNGASYENEYGGQIRPGELTNQAFFGPVIDTTEPYWGSYVGCSRGPGNFCIVAGGGFDGSSSIYIGQHNRIAPTKYNFEMTVKSTSATSSFTIQFGAFDDGRGTCASTGQFGGGTVPTTSTWTTRTVAVDFTGRQGCVLQFQVLGATPDIFFGELNFIPQGTAITLTPPSDSIYNTSCPVNGQEFGVSSTGYKYACVAGTVKRFGPAS